MALTAEKRDPETASAARRRSVSVLGSTGSIGVSTLDLIEREREKYDLVAVTAHKNVTSLIEQARQNGYRQMISLDAADNEAMRDLADYLGFHRRLDPLDPSQAIHTLEL